MEPEDKNDQQGQAEAEAEPAANPAETAPQGAPEPDYEALYRETLAQSRKWERRAKAAGRASQDADVAERLRAAEEELAGLRAEREHAAAVAAVSGETGLSEAVVRALRGDTADELRASAVALRAAGAAYPRTRDGGEVGARPVTREDILAIKGRDERFEAIARNADLFRNK
jgi:hypothetical protein